MWKFWRGILFLLVFVSPAWAWEATDAKPVAVLELMDDYELASEASRACAQLTIGNQMYARYGISGIDSWMPQSKAASTYMDTIRLVARKKHNGTEPSWVREMEAGSQGTDHTQCLNVQQRVYDEQSP